MIVLTSQNAAQIVVLLAVGTAMLMILSTWITRRIDNADDGMVSFPLCATWLLVILGWCWVLSGITNPHPM